MKAYIAERGCYEDRYVAGVYASPELAMADQPGSFTKTTWAGPEDVPERYRDSHPPRRTSWDNDLDWNDAVSIHEIEVVTTGPERGPDKTRHQVFRETDGGWDYVAGDYP